MDWTSNYKSPYTQRLETNCNHEMRLLMHLPFPEKLEGTPTWVTWNDMKWHRTFYRLEICSDYDDEKNKISGSQTKIMIY